MRLVVLLMVFVLTLAPLGTSAQDNSDRGVLQAFLEDNLSDAGRVVRIEGFQGALSSRATVDKLTIADDRGVWLTVEGAVLDWNRSALLRGRLEVAELSAKSVEVARAPVTGDGPEPEARPFSLPDLPVSIDIDKLSIERLSLGAPLFGEAAVVTLSGSADLASGAGNAALEIRRVDGSEGTFTLDGRFSNATRRLTLALALEEAPDGITANLLGIPGRPSVSLNLQGDGPLGNFTANLSLATDGAQRLEGSVTLGTLPDPDDVEAALTAFTADVSGDLRPLVQEQYREFLGPEVALRAAGRRRADGRLELPDLTLRSGALSLEGEVFLAADGWPELLDLEGRVAPPEGDEVLLSIPGNKVWIGGARIDLDYDRATGDAWTLDLVLDRLRRTQFALESARLSGTGTIQPLARAVDGSLSLALAGIAPEDRDLARAIGPTLSGGVRFDWRRDGPLRLEELDLSGVDYGLTGQVDIATAREGFDLVLDGNVGLTSRDLSRFSGLVGQDIAGRADLTLRGNVTPISGAFDINASGETTNLALGIAQIDPLIAGRGTLALEAARSTTGLRLDRFEVETPTSKVSARGNLRTGSSDLALDIRVADAGVVIAGVSGPVTLDADVAQEGDDWTGRVVLTGPAETALGFDGTLRVVDGEPGPVEGRLRLATNDLAVWASLADLPLEGALDVRAEGRADLRDRTFNATLEGTGRELRTGNPEADKLLVGETTLALSARSEDGELVVFDRLELRNRRLNADLTGSLGPDRTRVRFSLDLADVAIFAPDFSGPATAQGVLSATGGPYEITADLTGPGGTSAALNGTVARDGATANLSARGEAPLALANVYIAPNLIGGRAAFDLRLNGPLALRSLSGRVTTGDARLTLPALKTALDAIDATVSLSGQRAEINASARVAQGGRATISGSTGIAAPFTSDLTITLADVAVEEPGVYQSTVSGQLRIDGPLLSTARISGDLGLGPTELRLATPGGGSDGALPGLVHLNEPRDVRQTRNRAGMIASDAGGLRVNYPLDITIRAPGRVFVRGRGLDAELGGTLRLRGTTVNVAPEGRFDLIRGRLDILGKRLVLDEGFAQLRGDFDPFVRVVASTVSGDITVRIIVEGFASAPEVTITSTPELPEEEIFSRLLFGKDITQISALQALRLASAINTLVGGGTGIVGRLRENFGLDDLDIETSETGETGLRLGKYINENLYTDVTVNTEGETEIQLNLSVTPSITAKGTFTSSRETGVGIYFERDY